MIGKSSMPPPLKPTAPTSGTSRCYRAKRRPVRVGYYGCGDAPPDASSTVAVASELESASAPDPNVSVGPQEKFGPNASGFRLNCSARPRFISVVTDWVVFRVFILAKGDLIWADRLCAVLPARSGI
ncbi:hypothetical protein B0H17DRAFT_1176628 [Mycena rosella]|uniref:Uncharacterized protein n=1 Tax=Mycena rosella TaxID=1033263 RepID=A0AAD7GQ66_MYCRO|nr:hypothetical protein B0H17DRAFT_1176628 [Mycena rosella]